MTAPAAARALEVCRRATESLPSLPESRRRDSVVRTLRQCLGYCWSVAVAADPAAGLDAFRALAGSADLDVRWIDRENRRKARLTRLL